MIKFDKNEFMKPQIYSTNDEYESRCNVTNEIVEDIKFIQKENEMLKNIISELEKYGHDTVGKYLYDNHLMIKVEDFLDKLNELKGDNK